jgi:signal transduction histidine kinase
VPDLFDSFYDIFIPDQKVDKLVLSVADNGYGIGAEEKEKLFKLFGCIK